MGNGATTPKPDPTTTTTATTPPTAPAATPPAAPTAPPPLPLDPPAATPPAAPEKEAPPAIDPQEHKALQDRLAEFEARETERAAQAEADRVANLSEQERLQEQLADHETIKADLAGLQTQAQEDAAFIQSMADNALSSLSEEDREVVKNLAGEDPRSVFKAIDTLKTAGKIGAHKAPKVDRTPIGSGGSGPAMPSDPWRAAALKTAREIELKQRGGR